MPSLPTPQRPRGYSPLLCRASGSAIPPPSAVGLQQPATAGRPGSSQRVRAGPSQGLWQPAAGQLGRGHGRRGGRAAGPGARAAPAQPPSQARQLSRAQPCRPACPRPPRASGRAPQMPSRSPRSRPSLRFRSICCGLCCRALPCMPAVRLLGCRCGSRSTASCGRRPTGCGSPSSGTVRWRRRAAGRGRLRWRGAWQRGRSWSATGPGPTCPARWWPCM
jgi:hypothetical protein